MKKKMFGLAIFVVVIVLSSSTIYATIFKTTWVGSITYIDANNSLANSIWNVGDEITFSATYSDTNNSISVYKDGANGAAELGSGDDYLWWTAPANQMYWNWSHDAAPTVDQRTQLFMSMLPDGTTSNNSYVSERITPKTLEGHYLSDGMKIWNLGEYGGIYVYENDQYLGFPVKWVNYDVTTTPSTVPIPGAVWFLSSGLASLIGLKRKKKLRHKR